VCDVYIEIAKDRAPTRACILGRVLSGALQLLHPIMPFITEELWQRLPHQEPRIGKYAWPDGAAAWIDKGSRSDMAQVLGFVDAVLALRGVPKLPYRELRDVFVDGASSELIGLLQRESEIVERLGRASTVRAIGDGEFPKPESALSRRLGTAQVFLPVDDAVIERERSSLDKEIEKTEREIDVIERKLASEGFVRKAPPEVVDGERRRLEELTRSFALARERRATL